MQALTLELLVPEELSAALLARVAHDPAIAALLAALLATTQGMEVGVCNRANEEGVWS